MSQQESVGRSNQHPGHQRSSTTKHHSHLQGGMWRGARSGAGARCQESGGRWRGRRGRRPTAQRRHPHWRWCPSWLLHLLPAACKALAAASVKWVLMHSGGGGVGAHAAAARSAILQDRASRQRATAVRRQRGVHAKRAGGGVRLLQLLLRGCGGGAGCWRHTKRCLCCGRRGRPPLLLPDRA